MSTHWMKKEKANRKLSSELWTYDRVIDPHVTLVAILKVVADVALDPWAKNKKEMKWKVVFCLLLKAKNTYIHLHTYICKKKERKKKKVKTSCYHDLEACGFLV